MSPGRSRRATGSRPSTASTVRARGRRFARAATRSCASSCEICSGRITGRCRRAPRRTRSRSRPRISRPPFVRSRRPRAARTARLHRRGFSSISTSSCTTFRPRWSTRAASPAPPTCRTARTPRTCTPTACTCIRERMPMARRETTRSFACCPGETGRSASAMPRDAPVRSNRTSASPRPTSSSRSEMSCALEPAAAAARPSHILRARTGITRIATARPTIRSPAALRASSSSKGMWTTRSIAR